MKFNSSRFLIATSVLFVALGACASSDKAKKSTTESMTQTSNEISKVGIPKDSIAELTASWPEASKKAIADMTNKYGQPNEATASMVVWHNSGPWKRTIVYKEEVTHLFPKKHTDVMQQFVDYRVPPEKFSALAIFDGSVIAERTNGELSARCDQEAMNMLALNLSYEILQSKKNPEEARKEYGKSAMAFMMGKKNQYTTKLNIPAQQNTPDPDHSLAKDTMGLSKAADDTSKQ